MTPVTSGSPKGFISKDPRRRSHSGSEAGFQNTQGSGFYSTQASLPRMDEAMEYPRDGEHGSAHLSSTAEAKKTSPVLNSIPPSITEASASAEHQREGSSRKEREDSMVADLCLRVEVATGEIYRYNEPVV